MEATGTVFPHPQRPDVRVTHGVCDACGAGERDILFSNVRDYDLDLPETYNVAKCRACGLAYPDPRPVTGSMPVYYPPDYNPFNPAQVKGPLARVKTIAERLKAKKVARLVGTHGSILDAGCSYGGFMHQLQQMGDWTLYGIDTDAGSIAYARQTYGLNTETLSFEELPESEVYDCVIMKYVLDHLPSPRAAFEKLARIIRPGGYLILQLPNRQSWEAEVFGKYWHGWEIPRHTAYFSERDIRRLATRYGFEVREVEHEATPNNWIWGLRYMALDHARPLAGFFTIKNPLLVLLFTPLGLLASLFRASGRVEYILQRQEAVPASH